MLLLLLAVTSLGAACRSPGAAPIESGDATNGVTIDNPTGLTVKIVYEAPDGTTEPLAELAPGGHSSSTRSSPSARACAAPAVSSR